jgi:hypothetical protein
MRVHGLRVPDLGRRDDLYGDLWDGPLKAAALSILPGCPLLFMVVTGQNDKTQLVRVVGAGGLTSLLGLADPATPTGWSGES